MLELTFQKEQASVAERLEGDATLGARADGSGEKEPTFIARVHDRPIAVSIRRWVGLHEGSRRAGYLKSFDLWIVPHRFSVMKDTRLWELVSAGCNVKYLEESGTIHILSLFPASEYVEVASWRLDVGADARAEVDVDFLQLSDLQKLGSLPSPIKSGSLNASWNLQSSIKLNLGAKVVTTSIAAIGSGSAECTFQFKKREMPLHDRDIETWALVAVSKHVESISYEMTCFMTAKLGFYAWPWRTPTAKVTVALPNKSGATRK